MAPETRAATVHVHFDFIVMFAADTPADLQSAVVRTDALKGRVIAHFGDAEGAKVVRAIDFVTSACRAAERLEALGNACGVAEILLDLDLDPDSVTATLIGCGIPTREIELDAIAGAFGAEVSELLRGIERAQKIEALTARQGGEAVSVEALRKMLLAMADDVRVVLIKLAERTQYMRTVTRADDATRRAAALQTRELFAPLANRLGIFQIKWELEDLSFRFMEPELYKKIAALLDGKRSAREQYIESVIQTLRGELEKLGIKGDISGRPKHIFSIHKKMQRKNLAFDELYDIRAVRVLVNNIRECYTVLGIVHDLWQPVAGEFDDYIAQPKLNDYRSLHTAVIGPEGKTLEVQIRTFDMHRESEHGVAAHWRYKEGASRQTAGDKRFDAKIAWLRQVLEWKRDLAESGGISAKVREGLFDDTVYVVTPQGRVVDLPAGSTPVDFAYHIHTDLGHRCRGAKLDGQIVPLNTPLKNAQRVEIMTAKTGGPSRDWLNRELGFLASPRGLAKVRQWFNKESFDQDVAAGRALLEKELQRAGQTGIKHEAVADQFGHDKTDDFLAALGRNEISPHQVENALRGKAAPVVQAPLHSQVPGVQRTSSGVLVLGINNIATLIAKCCKPVPPDPIIGFVTRTRGVTVHRHDCINIASLAPDQLERLLPAEWGHTGETWFAAEIEVVAADRQGLLRDISEAISREKVNVTAVNTVSKGTQAFMRFTVQITSAEIIERVKRAVGMVADVVSVVRR
jgi:GTP pyrophosphokinase